MLGLRQEYDYVVTDNSGEVLGTVRAGLLLENRLKTLLSEHFGEDVIELKAKPSYTIAVCREGEEHIFHTNITWIY